MVKLVNQTIFAAKMREKKISIFTAADVHSLFGLSPVAAVKLLHRYAVRGFIVRIKRGLYVLSSEVPSELFVASKLYEPSYISREFALSYHRVIPETVYEVTSVTSKATRRFEKLGKVYSYRTVKTAAFVGYEIAKQNGLGFRIADPEKAFVDANYFRLRDGLEPLSRYNKEKVNAAKALRYASLFGNKKFTDSIKGILR